MADIHRNVNQLYDTMHIPYRTADRTEHIRLPESIGTGYVQRFVPRSDMIVSVTDVSLHEHRRIPFEFGKEMIEFTFDLRFLEQPRIDRDPPPPSQAAIGSSAMKLMSRMKGHIEFDGNSRINALDIHISASAFEGFMEGWDGSPSVGFHDVLGTSSLRVFEQEIDALTAHLVRQIALSPYAGTARRIHMESKVLELMSHSLQTFLFQRDPAAHPPSLSKTDVERIREARDVLMGRLDSPPSLLELSRLICLNDYKLKVGFKEVFGTTVFGYVREKRLEKAFILLQSGRWKVHEAAAEVGYLNASHFAGAFRKKFGMSPGEFVRQPVTHLPK